MLNASLVPATSNRVNHAHNIRIHAANADHGVLAPPQNDNGDEALYADRSGTYTKGIKQASIGVVDPVAYASFKKALASGDPADFAAILTGGPRTQNGPQGGLAFALDSLDPHQYGVPPAPAVASEAYATELIELYWASLLRDVAFSDYHAHATAIAAAAELSALPKYAGPRNTAGVVTPDLLFRGPTAGDRVGPYMSQLLLQPCSLGALPITQKYLTNQAGVDFMLDPVEFQQVQNGIATGKSLTPGAQLYLHDGRGLAAYTHGDVLYQAYFIAALVIDALGVPLNPGNPYAAGTAASKTQNGFASFGGPDITGTLAAVALEALRAVWYQKWWVHLRHRPESGGALVHLQKLGTPAQAKVSPTVLSSHAIKASHLANNNSWLLSQAFPEGSPTHPAYPTGHGTVAGACITALKFFYDGAYTFKSPVVPSSTGTSLSPYTGAPPLTLNGELDKLASNISFGHGVLAGIHWRSDTDTSIRLGEAVALSYLRDRALTCNETFSVKITKVDGGVEMIHRP